MKKLYVLAGALLASTGVFAQGHDLFFSAYNEGAHSTGSMPPGGGASSNGQERAMQIFNPTTATINMGQYSVARYSNGSPAVFQEEKCVRNTPSGTSNNNLTSADVFVIGAFKATLLDIINNMDQRASDYGPITNSTVITQGGPINFDGNDAMVLRRWTSGTAGTGTPVIIDIFGVIDQNPAGGAWFTNTTVGGQTLTVSSKNMSLNRKGNIQNGTRLNPDSTTYQIGDEWEVYSAYDGTGTPTNTAPYYAQSYTNLAGHSSMYTGTYGSYAPLGVLEQFNNDLKVYPNPVANKMVTIEIGKQKVSSITILNTLGQSISVSPANAAQKEIKVNVSSLKPGLYFVKFVSGDDYKMTVYKELLVQ